MKRLTAMLMLVAGAAIGQTNSMEPHPVGTIGETVSVVQTNVLVTFGSNSLHSATGTCDLVQWLLDQSGDALNNHHFGVALDLIRAALEQQQRMEKYKIKSLENRIKVLEQRPELRDGRK